MEAIRAAGASEWLVLLVLGLFLLNQIKALFGPKNLPPVYSEFPYIPWLGSIWQFATNPREFIQRGNLKHGDCFTVNLFGTSMTFLMSSEGHAAFFKVLFTEIIRL